MARFLDVYLKGELVGELEQDVSGALWFCYDGNWLQSEGAMALSISLPLREEKFKGNECRAFFAGLLPEEESRRLVAKAFGVSARNDFALLSKIGGECAGAVSVLPRGEHLHEVAHQYQPLSLLELEEKFKMLPTRPLLAGENGMRLSLAGAQGKLAVMIRDGKYHLSLEGAPSSHILKPESQHYSGLVENEFTCMRLAKAIGLEVAEVQMEITGEVEFLQVTRYDRMALKGGGLERVHQEDFCQALGIVPELKYQQEGGPNLKQCFNLIREVSTVPGLDVLRFFDAVIFNFLIGNNDAHGKNFSFLYTNTGVRLAPLYDLVCTQAYPDLADKMAMKIGGQRNPARLTPKNWEKFCEDAGLSVSASAKRIKQLVARTGEAIHELENSERSSKRVLDVVARNRVLLQSD